MTRESFIQQIRESEEYRLLEGLEDGTTTVETVLARVVDKAMAAHASMGGGRDGFRGAGTVDYAVSLAVLELAQRLDTRRQGRLAEFVAGLQRQVAVDQLSGAVVEVQQDALWADLPSFGYTELETWYEFGGEYGDPCDPRLDAEQKRRWVRLNAFEARLSELAEFEYGPPDIHPLDKSLRAAWTMAMALEGDRPPETMLGTAALAAACAWFEHAAGRLWANVLKERRFVEASGAGPGKRFEGRGWMGFERDRWDVWLQGLEGARDASEGGEERRMIEDALGHMKRVMQEG